MLPIERQSITFSWASCRWVYENIAPGDQINGEGGSSTKLSKEKYGKRRRRLDAEKTYTFPETPAACFTSDGEMGVRSKARS